MRVIIVHGLSIGVGGEESTSDVGGDDTSSSGVVEGEMSGSEGGGEVSSSGDWSYGSVEETEHMELSLSKQS